MKVIRTDDFGGDFDDDFNDDDFDDDDFGDDCKDYWRPPMDNIVKRC